MNDARLDALLAAADPLAEPLAEGIARDDTARAARSRIRSSRRRRSVPRIALATAGFAALAAFFLALIIAAPGRDAAPAGSGLIATSDRVAMRPFDVPMLIRGESHKVGWNYPHGSPSVVAPHPAIVTFADDGCAPCRDNVRTVQHLWATEAVGDLAALGVAGPLDGRATTLTKWWTSLGATFPLAVDKGRAASRALGAGAEPLTVLIDRRSRVAARFEGAVDSAALEAAVTALLAEPVPRQAPAPGPIPGPVPASVLHLSVFDLSASAAAPPHGLITFPGRVYEESIRRALVGRSGRAVWVARAPGDVIVAAIAGPTGVSAVSADSAARLARTGTIGASGDDGAHSPWYLGGVVPDGYTRAFGGGRSVPIRHNAFLFEGGRHFSRVTVTGPAGTRTIGR